VHLAAEEEWSMELPEPGAFVGILLFSTLGLWAFKEGRREVNIKLLLVGIALMAFGYFTPQTWLVWVVGSGLTVLAFKFRD
jgi:ABC-type uncharacterized transport system fused permease/ATPase subunit